MAFTPYPLVQMGDALLGWLARAFVLVAVYLAPTMTKGFSWDYSDEEMGPLVPEWSIETDTNVSNWNVRRAEFA
ncbi:hypothetical protein KRP22_009590 [Phytophthora ramorum]|nr:hypothetical protein KRP22_8423 [Phytophthora ramorum]